MRLKYKETTLNLTIHHGGDIHVNEHKMKSQNPQEPYDSAGEPVSTSTNAMQGKRDKTKTIIRKREERQPAEREPFHSLKPAISSKTSSLLIAPFRDIQGLNFGFVSRQRASTADAKERTRASKINFNDSE
ncbi:hypothetical protein HO133_006692 [Letharia lupina]|uniref:Uncharacterized protein n=1 Tax=Letharia lupina TaxID=560253 RepID=A0A8H6C580_9LECA|nr:uncharacterized protein HO133_006692 [Letharia lupina]KAF6217590.1 hypothetical protein HO133_006692 [Letharia lupina]